LLWDRASSWLLGGNTIVRVGVVILFIGLAFLMKFAADNDLLPIEFRLATVGAGAIAMLLFGWRLRAKEGRQEYALTLQGAGVGVLYLTVFSAFSFYQLIPAAAAFPMLVVLAAFSTILAMRQDSFALATFGVVGGFMAPVFISTGGGNHVVLLSYYAVLNAGIFYAAWHKSWRPLNVVGFLFTFVISAAWGYKYYRPEHLATTEPFLILFFVAYLVIAIRYAFRQAPKLTNYVDGTLIFGVPIAGFGLQAGIMSTVEYGLAFSSLTLSALYLGLATWIKRSKRDDLTLLAESFQALGVIFGVLVVPLALDARWTSAAWALEGAAIYWIGVRQHRLIARALGVGLQLFAGCAFVVGAKPPVEAIVFLNSQFIGFALLAGSALFMAALIRRTPDGVLPLEQKLVLPLFAWGLFWWLIGGAGQIMTHTQFQGSLVAFFAFASMTTLAFKLLEVKQGLSEGRLIAALQTPIMVLTACAAYMYHERFFLNGGWAAWPFAFVVQGYLLYQEDKQESLRADRVTATANTNTSQYRILCHTASVLLIAFIGSIELASIGASGSGLGSAWQYGAMAVVPALLLLALSSRPLAQVWPVRQHPQTYLMASTVLVGALMCWGVYTNLVNGGNSSPLPYIPFLNPIDLAHVLIILGALMWWRAGREIGWIARERMHVVALSGALLFGWLNAVLLRSVHQYGDVPYRLEALWGSVVVQTGLSITWTVLAMTLMVIGAKRVNRPIWILGGLLMAVVVAKLLMVDLGSLAGIERIISFIGVGVLMLIIGYVAPVPPAKCIERAPNAPDEPAVEAQSAGRPA